MESQSHNSVSDRIRRAVLFASVFAGMVVELIATQPKQSAATAVVACYSVAVEAYFLKRISLFAMCIGVSVIVTGTLTTVLGAERSVLRGAFYCVIALQWIIMGREVWVE